MARCTGRKQLADGRPRPGGGKSTSDRFLDEAIARLKSEIGQPDSADVLRAYLAEDDGRPSFTGSRFDDFDGGGDRPEVANRFTPADLVAATFLSVQVPPRPALWLSEDPTGQLHELLREIPAGVDPSDPAGAEELTAPDSHASRLWTLLDEQVGLGWVTVSKLLARKRPHLLPVYDQVLKGVVQPPRTGWWVTIAEAFTDADFVASVADLRGEARAEHLSLLRTIDIVVWMRHHDEYRRGSGSS